MSYLVPAQRPVEDAIDDGYDAKPLQYVYGGWYVFKSRPAAFVSLAVVFLLANEALSRLFLAPSSSGSLRTELFYTLPLQMARLGLFHGMEALMLAGIGVMAWQQLDNRPLSPMAFFKDWRSVGLVLACAAAITLVAWTPIMFITSLPFVGGALAARVTLRGVIVLTLLGVILFVYIMVSYVFAYFVLIDRKDGMWKALEGSRRVVQRHWAKIAGLMFLVMALNVEMYCLLGSALEIMSPGLGFHWFCMTEIAGGQGAFVFIVFTALGRAISGCVLAVAYADIYGTPMTIE